MQFRLLIKLLKLYSFEDIIKILDCEIPIECFKNEVFYDDDLIEFLKELNAYIDDFKNDYVIIKTKDNKVFSFPYKIIPNRFDCECGDEIIINFNYNELYN